MELSEFGVICDSSTSKIREIDKAGALYTTVAAADVLGVSPIMLRFWQLRGTGPSYLHIRIQSKKVIFYSLSDLQAFALAEVRGRSLLQPKHGGRSS